MHGSGRWAAPPNHPHGEMTFSLLLTYSQPGGSPRPHVALRSATRSTSPGMDAKGGAESVSALET